MAIARAGVKLARRISWVDLCLFAGLFFLVYAFIGVAFEWTGPYRPKTEIDLGVGALARYSFFSLVRVSIAYLFSLAFTFTYGYAAARTRWGEAILIPLLDILQSVPVLGFMPGLVLALVALFPGSNIGLELAAVLMIFTGQGWNLVFSFYSSLKAVPTELREMGTLFRLSKWEQLKQIEIPFAMNGLLWNSMLSMAGGWFFVMTIESFSLGEKDFRLPGIGSYMAVAYERGDLRAVCLGIVAMFTLIIGVDRVIWAPLVVWSERFKFDSEARRGMPDSVILRWLKRSRILAEFYRWQEESRKEMQRAQPVAKGRLRLGNWEKWRPWLKAAKYLGALGGALFVGYAFRGMYQLLGAMPQSSWFGHVRDSVLTLLRVSAAVILGSLWTIPAGVFIGTNPKWTRRLQPVVQIVASFPAPMLFPMIIFMLLKLHISLDFGAVVLMLFASQWYILFNVIAGATLIPRQMIDVAKVFRLRGVHYWRAIIGPAIFPSLVNGWITAAGGAWNACIVSEFVLYQRHELAATGIGATITRAAQTGDFPNLAAAIFTMVMTVVLLNRFFWGSLYRLAETRFRLET